MQIIPVIDLMQGQVVHAKFGLRSQYQPIQSNLCNNSSPLAVVEALLKLYPFHTLYIADLDAILGVGHHTEVIEIIAETYPELTVWLDSGTRQANHFAPYKSHKIKIVIGSENITNLQDYHAISEACNGQHILSLDYDATGQLGIDNLHQSATFWPDSIICMTLNAVGGEQGVDSKRLKTLIELNQTRIFPSKIYAAGGVKNVSDILPLTHLGISGALVASALHNENISSEDLVFLQKI